MMPLPLYARFLSPVTGPTGPGNFGARGLS